MDVQFPRKDRIVESLNILIDSFSKNQIIIHEMTSELVKLQRFEHSADTRGIEKDVEIIVEKLSKIVESLTHNTL